MLVSHLFWGCDFVLKLWQEIRAWLAPLETNLPLDRTKLLFGIFDEPSNSILNYIILCAKHYILRSKFTSKNISLIMYQKYLYQKLNEIKNALIFMGEESKFEKWNDIYEFLSRLPECSDPTKAPMPALTPAGPPPPGQHPTAV